MAHLSIKASEEVQSKITLVDYDWTIDPYEVDAEATQLYTKMYFDHINAATHQWFLRDAFNGWLSKTRRMSRHSIMLIYAMLALGTLFSVSHDRKSDAQTLVEIARVAVTNHREEYALQLVQSRILLAFYYFATGGSEVAWDFLGQSIRAATVTKGGTGHERETGHSLATVRWEVIGHERKTGRWTQGGNWSQEREWSQERDWSQEGDWCLDSVASSKEP